MTSTPSRAQDPCGVCTEEGTVTQPGAGGRGLGRLSGVKPKLSLEGGFMGIKPSCVCQRDGVSDREDNFRKTERGNAVGAHGGLQAVQYPGLCTSKNLILSELFGVQLASFS